MYNVDQDEKIMGLFESIANQPIDETPFNIIRNPKPVCESVMLFDDAKVDFSKWTSGEGVKTDAKKVGKAKTAPEKTVEPVTKVDMTTTKTDDGKDVAITVDSKATASCSEPVAGNGGSFNNTAKTAADDQREAADKNKHFDDKGRQHYEKVCDMFRKHVKKLVVDEQTAKDAEKILAKFDQITKFGGKPKMESIVDGRYIPADCLNMITGFAMGKDLDPITAAQVAPDVYLMYTERGGSFENGCGKPSDPELFKQVFDEVSTEPVDDIEVGMVMECGKKKAETPVA